MIHIVESIMRIVFIVLTFVWAGKILIFRTDKQIVINPILMIIAAILAIMPSAGTSALVFGFSVIKIRIFLYTIYSLLILFGLYSIRKRNALF